MRKTLIARVGQTLSALSLMAVLPLLAGESFVLVTEQEYFAQLGKEKHGQQNFQLKLRSTKPDTQQEPAPVITITAPSNTTGLYSPIDIEVNFKAPDDAVIQANSLKVFYGWLNLDITDRIVRHAEVSYTGIKADNVILPAGKHNITIQISDSQERTTEKEITVEILKS